MRESCETCRFYRVIEEGSEAGECRRHAPVIIRPDNFDALWPDVYDFDWCGEYQPKTTVVCCSPMGS